MVRIAQCLLEKITFFEQFTFKQMTTYTNWCIVWQEIIKANPHQQQRKQLIPLRGSRILILRHELKNLRTQKMKDEKDEPYNECANRREHTVMK
jgi:hypothetical protein